MSYGTDIDSLIAVLKAKTKEVDEDITKMKGLKGDEHSKRYQLAKKKMEEARNAKQQLDILARKMEGANADKLKKVCFFFI